MLEQSDKLERKILSAILSNSNAMRIADRMLTNEDFSNPTYCEIYEVCEDMHKQGLQTESVMVYQYCLKNGKNVKMPEILQISTEGVSIANLEHECLMVLDVSVKRKAAEYLNEKIAELLSPIDFCSDILTDIEKKLLELKRRVSRLRKKDLVETITELREEISNPNFNPPINLLGWHEFDSKLRLRKQELIILAGRPSMGKSFLATTGIVNLAHRQNLKVLYFSLEMSDKQNMKRMMSNIGNLDFNKINTGTQELNSRVDEACDFFLSGNIIFEDNSSVNALDIRNRTIDTQPDIVLIDHGGLMSHNMLDKGNSRTDQIGESTKMLKQLSKDMDIPVVLLWQLNRGNTQRADLRPSLSDLRGSGRVEEDADIVVFIHRPAYYEKDSTDKAYTEFYIDKNRDGETFKQEAFFEPQYARFRELTMDEKDHYDMERQTPNPFD